MHRLICLISDKISMLGFGMKPGSQDTCDHGNYIPFLLVYQLKESTFLHSLYGCAHSLTINCARMTWDPQPASHLWLMFTYVSNSEEPSVVLFVQIHPLAGSCIHPVIIILFCLVLCEYFKSDRTYSTIHQPSKRQQWTSSHHHCILYLSLQCVVSTNNKFNLVCQTCCIALTCKCLLAKFSH